MWIISSFKTRGVDRNSVDTGPAPIRTSTPMPDRTRSGYQIQGDLLFHFVRYRDITADPG
jgi:hypothetical protein